MAGKSGAGTGPTDEPLPSDELANWLASHNWQLVPGDPDQLVRDFVLANFIAAVEAIQQVAPLAEAADHHPDLLISGYKHLRVSLSTHSAKAITAKDLALAEQIDALGLG